MTELIEYIDKDICFKLPKQLRQKRPILFFRGNLKRGKPETHMSIGIDTNFNTIRVNAIKELFKNTVIQNRSQKDKVERLGPCEFGKDGLELLTSFIQPHTGYKFYRWDLIFSLGGKYLMISITGGHDLDDFEKLSKEVIMSLKFIG